MYVGTVYKVLCDKVLILYRTTIEWLSTKVKYLVSEAENHLVVFETRFSL